MGNALTPNLVLLNNGEYFHAVWKYSRTMLAAGWKYQASGNGVASGITNMNASGVAASTSAAVSNVQTLTGLANLTAGCVGQYITLSNTDVANTGTFLILSFVSSSSVTIYNPAGTVDSHNPNVHWNLVRAPSLDVWAVGGAVHLTNVSGGGSGTGTGVSIGAASATTGQSTITGLTGFSQNLSPGRFLTITGSAVLTTSGNLTYSNNGSFRIVAVNAAGTSVTVYAPQLIAETVNPTLAVVEQYGGADGTIGAFSTVTTGASYLLNFTTSSFNSFSAADVGRRITIFNATSLTNNNSFVIAQVLSSNNVLLYNPSGVANDTPVGTIQWVEWDPLQQLYPSFLFANGGLGAWLVLSGPNILKIPIGSNVPTGTFIRGENVTQTTTGAQGELLGVITDSTGGTGYLVIAPRVGGTGGQASPITTWGWNNSANTDTITGSISGATVTTPVSSTPIAYTREIVFWKFNNGSGHIYYQCVDQNTATESATTASTGRFSIMANTLSQVTPQICPGGSTGGSPVTNGFPTVGTMVWMGTGGSGAAGTGQVFFPNGTISNLTNPGRAHCLCANAIEQQGISADGTSIYMQSASSTGYSAIGFLRMDNQEDGDLDPYVVWAPSGWWGFNSGGTVPTRTAAVSSSTGSSATDNLNTSPGWWTSGASSENWRGFRRRGLSNETGFITFSAALLWFQGYSAAPIWTNTANPDEIATAATTTYIREPIWLCAGSANSGGFVGLPRMRKGTVRWIMLTIGLPVNQTLDNLKWISGSSTGAMFVLGPWDGVTLPTF